MDGLSSIRAQAALISIVDDCAAQMLRIALLRRQGFRTKTQHPYHRKGNISEAKRLKDTFYAQ
jgi:hypothetical protein